MYLRKRIVCFALIACIALQPIGMHASQSIPSSPTSFFSLSLFNSDNWKKYAAGLFAAAAATAGVYKLYRWWTAPKPAVGEIKLVNFTQLPQQPAKPQEKPVSNQPQQPAQKNEKELNPGQQRRTIDLPQKQQNVNEMPRNPSIQTAPAKTNQIEDPVQKKINEYLMQWGCQNALKEKENEAPEESSSLLYAGQGALKLINKSLLHLNLLSNPPYLGNPDTPQRKEIVKNLLKQAEEEFEKTTHNSSYNFQLDNLSRESQRDLLNIAWINIAIGDSGEFTKAYFWIARAKEIYPSAEDVYKFLKLWKEHSSLYENDAGLEQAINFVRLKADKDAREKLDASTVPIKQYITDYVRSNWDYMVEAFIDEPKTRFLFNIKDESESEDLIKGLIDELRNKYASKVESDKDFKNAIMNEFKGFDPEGREGLSALIDKSIENMQNLPEKLEAQRSIEPVQRQEIHQQREEPLGVPIISQEELLGVPQPKTSLVAKKQLEQAPEVEEELTPKEKEYLVSKFIRHPEFALTPDKNLSNQQDEILWGGEGALSIISPVLMGLKYESQDKKEFLKNLLGKAETVFSYYFSKGYRSLNSNMDLADEEAIKSLSWERPKKTDGKYDFSQSSPLKTYFLTNKMNEGGSKANRAKLTQVDFWLIKTAAITGTSLWATSAEMACNNLKAWQENTVAFKDDKAFKRAVKIACEAAEIERERNKKELPKALEAK